MSPRLVIVSCTERSPESRADLLIAQSFDHGGFGRFAELDIVWGNAAGLPTVYNRKMLQYAETSVEHLAFVHDDVYLDDLKLLDKLVTAHDKLGYEIVGAAGATKVNVGHPALWHLMSDPSARRGYVHHFSKAGEIQCTSFGPTPSEVAVIDGLFMAVHLPSVRRKEWTFNEEYEFHHYDLASSLDAVARGVKVGVYPIHLIHESPGLDSLSNPQWSASNKRFLSDYGNLMR
jgi:hypothetical protein